MLEKASLNILTYSFYLHNSTLYTDLQSFFRIYSNDTGILRKYNLYIL